MAASPETNARLTNNFSYHPPFGNQTDRYTAIRSAAHGLASLLTDVCPDSRERSIALTDIESAVMWANASIARNEKPPSE